MEALNKNQISSGRSLQSSQISQPCLTSPAELIFEHLFGSFFGHFLDPFSEVPKQLFHPDARAASPSCHRTKDVPAPRPSAARHPLLGGGDVESIPVL